MDEEAIQLMDEFDTLADRTMNASNFDVLMQLWNRAHLKALKMAALLAVGCNPHNAVVNGAMARWAIAYVKRDIGTMLSRFSTGDIGMGDGKQLNDMKRVIKHYFSAPPKNVKDSEEGALLSDGLITYRYILRTATQLASFKNDRLGATQAIKKTLQALLEGGEITQLPALTVTTKYKFNGIVYGLVGKWV